MAENEDKINELGLAIRELQDMLERVTTDRDEWRERANAAEGEAQAGLSKLGAQLAKALEERDAALAQADK